MFDCHTLPIPTQTPPTPPERLRPNDYDVYDEVETEIFVYGSGELFLDESALEYQKMSEDSDSETEDQYMGGWGSLISRRGLFLWWSIFICVVNGAFLVSRIMDSLTPVVFSSIVVFIGRGIIMCCL